MIKTFQIGVTGFQGRKLHLAALGAVATLALGLTSAISAPPPIVSQVIQASAPIYDQSGKILQGNEPSREELGMHYIRGCYVQILLTTNDVIYPPFKDGRNDPRNELLGSSYIGYGIDPDEYFPGKFSTMLSPRPAHGAKIFVRVFNQPSLEISAFYSDSQIYTVSQLADTCFFADVPNTTIPLDADDDDGDGLNNSWEVVNGSHPDKVDTDGDGYTDLEEMAAGTDSDDIDNFLQIVGISRVGNSLLVQYMSGRDKQYHVQQANNLQSTNCFAVCSAITTGQVSGISTVSIAIDPNEPVQILRFGVPVP